MENSVRCRAVRMWVLMNVRTDGVVVDSQPHLQRQIEVSAEEKRERNKREKKGGRMGRIIICPGDA